MQNNTLTKLTGLLAATVLISCVSTGAVKEKAAAPTDMATMYADKARALEQGGDIVQAAHFYRLALTVAPENTETAQSLERVAARRRELAEQYYRKGTDQYARGKYADSRRSLLTALRLQPDHAGALEKLKSRPRIAAKRFILHTVQPGESISTIAKKYYSDPRQYALIAQYNNLPDATRIRLGQELKIPEIDGLPFTVDTESQPIQTEAVGSESMAAWPSEEADDYAEPTKGESVQNQVAGYRAAGHDFLRAKKYDAAIAEFNKVLAAQPNNEAVKNDIYKAHYEWGRELMRQEKYLPARHQFEKTLALDSSCQQCHGYIEECESAYKELHYQRGIQLFGAEKPDAAIAEWEMVRERDPGYKQVNQYIKKAETISENIKKLKQQTN